MSSIKIKKIRTPYERCYNYYDILSKAAKIVGANVIEEGYRVSKVTWLISSFLAAFFFFTGYTIYIGTIINKDYTILLQTLCMSATAIQGVVKLINCICKHHKLLTLRRESENIYFMYQHKTPKYREYLETSLTLMKNITYSLLSIYSIAISSLIGIPIYYRVFLKEQIFVVHFLLPGIDPESNKGHITLLIVQIIVASLGAAGNFACDCLLFLIIAQIPLLKNILSGKFDELNETLEHQQEAVDVTKTNVMLKDIFQWHQKYLNYSHMAKDSFFWIIFAQVITATNSIVCTIVCHFLGIMPSGPVYLIYSFFILYSYCGLGNLVEVANDDVTFAIYNSLWYKLTVPQQKMILIMLRESQTSEGMSIGGVAQLTLNTGLQLTKSIYTVAMLLNEFFNKN